MALNETSELLRGNNDCAFKSDFFSLACSEFKEDKLRNKIEHLKRLRERRRRRVLKSTRDIKLKQRKRPLFQKRRQQAKD